MAHSTNNGQPVLGVRRPIGVRGENLCCQCSFAWYTVAAMRSVVRFVCVAALLFACAKVRHDGAESGPSLQPQIGADARSALAAPSTTPGAAGAPAAPSTTPSSVAKGALAAPSAALSPDTSAAVPTTAIDTPRITIDMTTPNAAAPFLIQWEGLPAVSRDGKNIAVVLDAGLIHQNAVFLVLDGASGATRRSIALVSGKAADVYREGDSEYDGGVAAAVTASTEARVKEAHRILREGGYTGLPRVEVSLEPLSDAIGKAQAAGPNGGELRMPAQSGTVGTTTVTLDNDRLTIERAGQRVERRVPQWRHVEYYTPWRIHCAYHAAISEIAVDEARGRVVLLVEQYILSAGDICAQQARYHVIALH